MHLSTRHHPQRQHEPFPLIGVALVALLSLAALFVSFLVAPLAILTLFYVGFAISDRTKRHDGPLR